MVDYKLFIPSAGLGKRLGDLCVNLNKALVSIANKPAITYIIDKVPEDVEVVIALGYKKDILRQFLLLAYPNRKITFVEIDDCHIGLGYTILKCKKYLQTPFIFSSNDTIIEDNIKEPTCDWIGYANTAEVADYRTIKIEKEKVIIFEKNIPGLDRFPYIGLAGINDYNKFWYLMETGKNFGSITEGESYALKKMKLKAEIFRWFDVGSLSGLKKANNYFTVEKSYILPKVGENIWLLENDVIKYSDDKNFISERVSRADKLKGFVPTVTGTSENLYKYRKIRGHTLSDICNEEVFLKLLNFLNDFWKVDNNKLNCNDFYKKKTYKRINDYFVRYEQRDSKEIINGVCIPKMTDILTQIDWNLICNGVPTRYHGDLHFENILLGEDGEFCLLDWRQNFNGSLDYGDIYYDFAKLLHGLIISHPIVYNNQFTISVNDNIIDFSILVPYKLILFQEIFKIFIKNNGYNWKKVKLLTCLIFLNMATLHHDPYSRFLFFFGKYMLWREMKHNV